MRTKQLIRRAPLKRRTNPINFITSLAAALLASTVTAKAAEIPPIEEFARLPLLKQVRVSPGGKYMSARVGIDGSYNAVIYKFNKDGGIEATNGIKEDDERWISQFRWVNEDRLVFSLGFNSKRYGTDTVERRLYSLTAEPGKPTALFRHDKNKMPVQIEDDIVSWIDDDPNNILVQYRQSEASRSPHVMRVAVDKRRLHKTVQPLKTGIYNWQADYKGVIRAGQGYKDKAETKPYKIIRTGEADKWRDISHRIADGAPDFNILGFSSNPEIAYVKSAHEYDLGALYEYNITTDSFSKMIFRSQTAEIGRLYQSTTDGKIRGVSHSDVEWSDLKLKQEIKVIEEVFPDQSVSLIRESIDQKFAVYDISGATEPGRYYILDRATPNLITLPPQYPELEKRTLSPVVVKKYKARDGLEIKAYITLPAGAKTLDDVENAPFIIHPHGGPHSRDFLRFDYWTQFYASRGYGVLQMNFRGSTGSGQKFREAGAKEWGQAMQDDITDGAKWIISQGYANKDRLAILGGSYGGYAALMGAVKTPDLYQCAVSFAGVSDLPAMLRRDREYIGGKASANYIGRLWKDRKYLKENSPVERAQEVKIPVLLIHGEDDRVVDVTQSKKMRRALKSAGKAVEYIEYEKGDHYLSLYKNRVRFLEETERFLNKCM